MFEKMRQSRLLYWSLEALVIVCLVLGLSQLSFLFTPVGTFFSTLLIPILAAGFLFYLLNPLIRLLEKVHVPRGVGIALVLAVLIGALVVTIAAVIPNLITQVTQLVAGLPDLVKQLRTTISSLSKYRWYQQFDVGTMLAKIDIKPSQVLESVLGSFSGLPGIIGSVAGVVINLITIPVILIYMLKDGDRFVPSVQRILPDRYAEEIETVFGRMNDTLSHYIAGQAIECLFVGSFTFIGYLIIGMPYAFLLGFIAGITTLIPYLGPYIGIVPALAVALTQGWQKIALVIVVVVIVQMVDGNLIYPNVIGRSLDIHPLTIIILLLVAGNIWGLLGTILAVPVYAVLKTVATYTAELYRFHQNAHALGKIGVKPTDPPKKP